MSFIFSPWRKKEDKHRVAQPQPLVQEEYGVSTRGPGTADVIQKEKYGLFVLTDQEPPQGFNVDIVAVHGLGGEWDTTWTDENRKFWLQDFLPLDLPRARIMSYGYNAHTAFSKAVTDISDVAASLLDRLDNARQPPERKRPVIFISHSLGGIIVKKALILAHERSGSYGDLLGCVKALVFFGVPHRGADLAYWATFASTILQITQLGFATNTNFVIALQKNSPAFAQISEQFIERGAKLKIRTFYETEKLYNRLVVDKASAVLGQANEIYVGVEGANHISMCKFSDPKSQKYLQVSRPIKKLVDSVTSDPVPSLEDNQTCDEFRLPLPLDHPKVKAHPQWSGNKSGWELLGGNFPPGSKVSVASRKPGHLDIFALSDNGNVYTTSWSTDNHWSSMQNNWKSLGGSFVPGAKVSTIVRTHDHLDLFTCSTDGHVYTFAVPFGSSDLKADWRSLGGFFPPGAAVSALTRRSQQQDLFLCDKKGCIYTSWWSSGKDWSGITDKWSSMGGGIFPPGASVSAFSRTPDHLDLFICGLDGRVYTANWTRTSGWFGIDDYWTSLGGFFPPGAEVSVLARKPGQLDLFICGPDGCVYTSCWSVGMEWSAIKDNWNSLGGSFVPGAKVSVLSYTQDQLEVFTCGKDGHVYASHWYNKSTGWSSNRDGWMQIGGSFPPGVEVSAIAHTPNNLDLFACGDDGHVYTMSWKV